MANDAPGRLRQWRAEHGITLEELGDLVDEHKSVLSRVERGQLRLQPLVAIRVARLIGCRPSELSVKVGA